MLSILIATFNRASILGKTLDAFTNLDIKNVDYEIIIADNNSNDETCDVVKSYEQSLPIHYVFEPTQGKNYALNAALKVACGDIVVFTDDDVTPDPDWLNEIIQSSQRWPDVRVFGGKVVPVFPRIVSKKISEADFSSYVFAKYSPYQIEQVCEKTTPVGPNCWFRRSVFDDGYRYDPTIGPSGRGRISGSEMELFQRLVSSGEKIVYVPTAVVFHRIQEYQLKISYLLKRSYASGRGWVRVKGPDSKAILWFGAPRYMYRKIAEEVCKMIVKMIMGGNLLEPLMKIAGYRGCIQEYRHPSSK